MSKERSLLARMGYFILGLTVLLVAVQFLRGMLWVLYHVATLVLSAAIVAAVGYVVYLLLKSAANTSK